MRLNAPDFLIDVYRDLRDRRLLIPAGALLVALVAVPVLLSQSPAPPPPPPQTAGIEATAATPAVLAEQSGIRNYRERLDALREKNPFDQQFAFPEAGEGDIDEPAGGGAGGGIGEPQPEPGGAGGPDLPVNRPPADPVPPSGDGGGSGSPSQPSGNRGKRKIELTHLIMRRIDVRVGEAGSMERRDGVRDLTFLPSKKKPVVAFLGVSENGKRATFLVSADVTSTDGGGSCIPRPPEQCQFLNLREGQVRRLVYEPPGASGPTTYRLKLLDIRDVTKRIKD